MIKLTRKTEAIKLI